MVRKQMNTSKPLKIHYTSRNNIKEEFIMVVSVSLGQLLFYLISVIVAGLIGYSIKGDKK